VECEFFEEVKMKRILSRLVAFFSICSIFWSCNTTAAGDHSSRPPLVTAGETYIARIGGTCLGPCPDYEVYLFNDGRVIYRGNSHTTVSGIKRKNIPKERFEKLKSAIESSDLFQRPEAKDCLTDSPTVWIEADLGKGIRRRLVDFGCLSDRNTMWAVVELMDEIAGAQEWIQPHGNDTY